LELIWNSEVNAYKYIYTNQGFIAGSYNVDPNSLTVSGISSGGAMSTQFHFIYSSEVKGAGIFAAGEWRMKYDYMR